MGSRKYVRKRLFYKTERKRKILAQNVGAKKGNKKFCLENGTFFRKI